jgi:hypothetical protein
MLIFSTPVSIRPIITYFSKYNDNYFNFDNDNNDNNDDNDNRNNTRI